MTPDTRRVSASDGEVWSLRRGGVEIRAERLADLIAVAERLK